MQFTNLGKNDTHKKFLTLKHLSTSCGILRSNHCSLNYFSHLCYWALLSLHRHSSKSMYINTAHRSCHTGTWLIDKQKLPITPAAQDVVNYITEGAYLPCHTGLTSPTYYSYVIIIFNLIEQPSTSSWS